MTLTVDFISNPQGIVAGNALTQVRFWDKSITTNGVVTSWIWKFLPTRTFTATSSPNIIISTASSYFAVDDRVMLSNSGGALPTGLSSTVVYWVKAVTATYITISLTQGGAAVTYSDAGTGTHSIQQASDQQNPIIPYRSIAAGTYDVSLTCDDSGGTGATTTTKTGYINAATLAFSKPTNGGLFGRITIFIYDSSNATAINRVKTTNNNLFFQSLKCTPYIDKIGTATFKVYNMGGATATEIGLLTADKNVAIIAGRDVIWSGKISRAIQEKMSLYDTASPAQSWSVECDSDISKMRLQNVKAANQTSYNAPPGYIINKLVEPSAATDIDWRGAVNPSLITYEGANIQYTITSADMYSQFITLADLTGYDWRTRNDWVKYAYGASGYSSAAKTVTVSAITPYTTNSFAGKWLLFINSSSTIGIQAYGQVTSNSTTVLTMTTITNSGTPPASSDYVIILGNPVLDFSSDFRQPTYISTFTMNKARASTLQNGYEMNDLSDFKTVITKATAKGKNAYATSSSGKNTQIVASVAAKEVWDNQANFFQKCTYITYQTQSYVYSFDGHVTLVVIGQDNVYQVGDFIYIGVYNSAMGISFTNNTIQSISKQAQADGTLTTTLTLTTDKSFASATRYQSFCITRKLYLKNPENVIGPIYNLNICGDFLDIYDRTTVYTDAVYGKYLLVDVGVRPHFPGVLVSTGEYTEASPQTGSPINYFGIINKTATADQQITYADLEIYATNYLINHSFYYRKGTFWAFVYDYFKPDIRQPSEVSENGWLKPGDEICILQNTGDSPTDTQYGQYKNQWQIVGFTLDADTMQVTVELGDHERNTNTLINDKTSGINYTIT